MINHKNIKNIKPKRVVVFGGSGYIGKEIVKELKKRRINILEINSEQVNLLKSEAVAKICKQIQEKDVILILAGITPDKGKEIEHFKINILIMINIIKGIINSKGVSHIIYFSSDAVYGEKKGMVSEQTITQPCNAYGMMHYAREQLLKEYINNVPTLVIRPTMIYGKNDTHNAYGPNRFIRTALEKKEITINGNGSEMRDYIYIDDVVKITVEYIYKKTIGIVNLASGHSVSIRELREIIGKEMDNKIIFNFNSQVQAANYNRHYDTTVLMSSLKHIKITNLEIGIQKMIIS